MDGGMPMSSTDPGVIIERSGVKAEPHPVIQGPSLRDPATNSLASGNLGADFLPCRKCTWRPKE